MKKKFKRILIANRGEIAIRVIHTCREMEIETITLYTQEERDLPHVYESDKAICLGRGALSETYLNIKKIVDICLKEKVDAVHPGYGFLSENAEFARALKSAGVILIGPPVDAMLTMGDKTASKVAMENIDIPLIPGYHGENQDPQFLSNEAKKIGYPVLIKARAGGGGKGMRIVHKESEFSEGLDAAKREAMNAFGDDQVLIEKFIQNPRHIEIQVMSDQHGGHYHLFERECSIQRRYQKIVEESPSPAVSKELREEMAAVGTKISAHMNYVGAGTIEFILDDDGKFYFLEMNTRLQVEHPVTEMVTGLDLVRLQILAAQGDKFDFKQEDLEQKGHALEVRLYAENPDNNFLPSIGKIKKVGSVNTPGTRLDTGYVDGNSVTISFDPMLAKLIVHANDRNSAILKMKKAIESVPFFGLKTNREYLGRILNHESFKAGDTFTHFVQTYESELGPVQLSEDEKAQAIAAFLMAPQKGIANKNSNAHNPLGPWDQLSGFRNV